ncbi:hypothetical protein FC093_04355 [Ilyomonas limi]|jgi:hypothetical protein|uniref:Uncharacterized protein n=1 Tax=Ilyomonas limi TaxID=2575867 RepID=A0A4U3L7A2_9BACT|nr:hypothetical protein [Ilyomonas limi]TKK70930.1 hypothetical protein FC093_04355 [Ilyomonas limi]
MNNNSKRTIINMGAAELINLTTEVKETVANLATHNRTFSAADLWNIQKSRKTQNLSKRPMLSRRNSIL